MRKQLLILLSIFFLSTLITYGQYAEIKKIIFDDLIYLNDTYIGSIVDNDLILSANSSRIDSIVEIMHIDSFSRYYLIQVRFNGIFSNCYPLFLKESSSRFNYIVYRLDDRYARVYGFLISEIMSLPLSDIFGLKLVSESADVNFKIRKIKRAIKYRNIDIIKREFKSSILLNISNNSIPINPNSYLIDDRVLWCGSTD